MIFCCLKAYAKELEVDPPSRPKCDECKTTAIVTNLCTLKSMTCADIEIFEALKNNADEDYVDAPLGQLDRVVDVTQTSGSAHTARAQTRAIQLCITTDCSLHNLQRFNSNYMSVIRPAEFQRVMPYAPNVQQRCEHAHPYSEAPAVSEQLKTADKMFSLFSLNSSGTLRSLTADSCVRSLECGFACDKVDNMHRAVTKGSSASLSSAMDSSTRRLHPTTAALLPPCLEMKSAAEDIHSWGAESGPPMQVCRVQRLNSFIEFPHLSVQQQQHSMKHQSLSGGFAFVKPSSSSSSSSSTINATLVRQTAFEREWEFDTGNSCPATASSCRRKTRLPYMHWKDDPALRRRRIEILASKIALPEFTAKHVPVRHTTLSE